MDLEVRLDAVDFSYGAALVLSDISLSVSRGTRLGIVGESGSGKTTLGRLLVGVLHHPQVTVNGEPWSRVARNRDLRRQVQMMFQDPFAALTSYTPVWDAVYEAARYSRGLGKAQSRALATDLLEAVGLEGPAVARLPRDLSGGQCQRVALARALAADPALIVADEPTSALDVMVQAQVINLLLEVMASRDLGFVLISHDLAVVRHLTTDLIVMQKGRIVERGNTTHILRDAQHEYTKLLCSAIDARASHPDAHA